MLSNNGLYIKTSSNKSDDVFKKDNAFALNSYSSIIVVQIRILKNVQGMHNESSHIIISIFQNSDFIVF